MLSRSRNRLTTAAAVGAAALGGATIADAASSSSSPTAQRPAGGAGETALTGTTADKVRAAALAKVPGTVVRVETDRGGVYEAHIRKADGTEVEVAVDKDFAVTGVSERGDGGPGHRGGPGGREDLAPVARTLGVTEAELSAAVDAARPDPGTRPARGDRAAALAKALGVETAAVQRILDANRPARPSGGDRGARPDESKLVAALADGLSLDEAKVTSAVAAAETAHRTSHESERTAMYAAVAKAIDKTPAQVKAAFAAARPTP